MKPPAPAVPHSFAQQGEGARLFAPSAARNVAPICDLLARFAPTTGRALELASGTGQHVTQFAARLPGLHWHPSEIDPARRASIDALGADAGVSNIAPAMDLNATAPGWGAKHAGQDLIVLCNLLHLISQAETQTLIHEAARALAPKGRLVIYGPFTRGGELTSAGDIAFHESLSGADPRIGYKDDFDVMDLMITAGLEMVEIVEMPANNLALVAER